MVFYQMDTEEVSNRFVAPCFVNGLEAYDGEINLGVEENMILNKYVVKLCLEHEVRRGNKVVKKELIVALKGEIYFVKFIINPEEDDVKPEVNFGRSFLCMTKAVTDFGAGTFTIYPDIDPFLEETEAKEKSNEDWDNLLDFNIDDIPLLGEEGLPPFVCKMGKSSRNKKRAMENLNFFYQDIGTSSSDDEEERPIIETIAYHDKYKKILDEVWKDKVELDGKIIKERRKKKFKTQWDTYNVPVKVGVTTLIAKFLILDIPIDCDSPIVVGRGFLRTIGSIVNTPKRLFSMFDGFYHQTFRTARSDVMRNTKSDSDDEEDYRYEEKRLEEGEPHDVEVDHHDPNALDNMKPWKRMDYDGEIDDILRIRLREAGSDEEIFTSVAWIRAFNINEPIYAELCHGFYSTYEFDEVCADDELGLYQAVEIEEEGFNIYFEGGLHSDEHFNAQDYWLSICREENLGLSRSHTSTIRNPILRLLSMFDARHQNGYENVAWVIARWMKRKGAGTPKESQICCGQFISKIARKCNGVDSGCWMGRMEIRQEAIEQMEYKQSYYWDRYRGVFEHMAGVYSVPMQGAYNPPGYAQPQKKKKEDVKRK
ncbi:hypothetical protein Tco_0188910 [Tanacetum coccineum]